MIRGFTLFSLLAGLASLASCSQATLDADGCGHGAYPSVGVALSPRECAVSRPTRLSNGKVALRPYNYGPEWLYGAGDSYGKASGKPTVDGVTPSQLANTPSGGLVPGQDPF